MAKVIQRIKLFLGKKDYCPVCLNVFSEEDQKKHDAGYNVTCPKCGTYIEQI